MIATRRSSVVRIQSLLFTKRSSQYLVACIATINVWLSLLVERILIRGFLLINLSLFILLYLFILPYLLQNNIGLFYLV